MNIIILNPIPIKAFIVFAFTVYTHLRYITQRLSCYCTEIWGIIFRYISSLINFEIIVQMILDALKVFGVEFIHLVFLTLFNKTEIIT